jgi:hypothetical protein
MESHSTICINNLKIFKSSNSVIYSLEHSAEVNYLTHETSIELSACYVPGVEAGAGHTASWHST